MKRIFLLSITILIFFPALLAQKTELEAITKNGVAQLQSLDKNFKYKLTARMQSDATYFFDKTANNPIGNGVAFRRMRMGYKAKLYKNWETEFEFDFAEGLIEIKDMILQYNLPKQNIYIKTGHFKEPFSLQTLTSSKYLLLPERSIIYKLTPSRHIGTSITFFNNTITASSGIFFQKADAAEEITTTQDVNKSIGRDEGLSFTSRVVLHPFYTKYSTVHLAANYSYRLPKTSWGAPEVYDFSTRSLSNINRKKYIATPDLTNVTNVQLFDIEGAYFIRKFRIQGEYAWSEIYRTAQRAVKIRGAYLQASYLLFGKYTYEIEEGVFDKIDFEDKSFNMDFVTRFDYLNANSPEAGIYAGSMMAFTAGTNIYVNPNVKFALTYTYTQHDKYANGDGDYYIGYTQDGILTTDPELVQGDGGEKFGFVNLRISVFF